MQKMSVILSLILIIGCSSERVPLRHDTIDWSKGKDTAIPGIVIVQIDATNRASLFENVQGESRLDAKDKKLIIDAFLSVDYTCCRVRKTGANGKKFLFIYGDCFPDSTGGFGNSTLYECTNGEWQTIGGCHYD